MDHRGSAVFLRRYEPDQVQRVSSQVLKWTTPNEIVRRIIACRTDRVNTNRMGTFMSGSMSFIFSLTHVSPQ